MQPHAPVVVVGGNLNALGVVRSLARAGIAAYALGTSRDCPTAWSRHCRFVPVARLHGEPLIEGLTRLARCLSQRPALLLTHDTSVDTVSAHRPVLEPLYHIDLPAAPIVAALSDKLAFQTLAEREGFAVPRSRAVRGTQDLDRITELTPPMILKPAEKAWVLGSGVERALRAETVPEARSHAVRMLAKAPAIIVQEWIPGEDSDIYFTLFLADGTGAPAALFTGRKLRCWPEGVGSTAVCAAAPECAATLGLQTRQFLARVPYRGLGSLEFKRHARTGQFLIVEPTVGRTDWQEEIATLCGINLPALAHAQASGQRLPDAPAGQGTRPLAWRSEWGFRVPAELRRRLRLIDGYFRWNDPLPALYHYAYTRGAGRLWRRARRWIQPATQQLPRVH
jgi:predicted ATP-grasp superfamily ATP-dependent carboligase